MNGVNWNHPKIQSIYIFFATKKLLNLKFFFKSLLKIQFLIFAIYSSSFDAFKTQSSIFSLVVKINNPKKRLLIRLIRNPLNKKKMRVDFDYETEFCTALSYFI